MAGSHIAHAAYKGPSVVKEIMIGIALGIVAGGLWKMHHWNNQRRTKEFYDLLDKNEISVVVNDDVLSAAAVVKETLKDRVTQLDGKVDHLDGVILRIF